jgi:hypothetical protein
MERFMRSHSSRSGYWFLVSALTIAVGCTGGSDSGSSHQSPLKTNVLVARSSDGGATWTAPSALNAAATEELGSDAAPQVTTDTLGTWISAWHSSKLGSLPRTDYDILLARSTDDGATWKDHAELNTNAGTDEGGDTWVVQLATDEQGVWLAIWQSWDSLGGAIGTDGDILVARSANDGLSWTDPAPLNTTAYTDTEDDRNPQLTTDAAGNWVVVWYTPEGYNRPAPDNADRDILFARSADDGASWTDPVPLNTNADDDPGGDTNPQLATDATTWIAIWELKDVAPSVREYPDAIGPDADILWARSIDAGATWTDPAPVNNNAADKENRPIRYTPGDDRRPQLATDGSIWIAVWDSRDDLGSLVPQNDRIGTDTDILFAHSTDDGDTWTDPAPLNNNAVTDGNTADLSPTLTTDGTIWLVTWLSGNTLGDTIGSDVDILMARSTDGGLTWTDPEPLNANAASDTGDDDDQAVTTDGQGNWVATWHATDWP